MNPKDARLDQKDVPEEPLENQQKEWEEEDIEIEGRDPDEAETEEDEAGL